MTMNPQMNQFNNRIARIKDPRVNSYFDPETKMNIPRRLSIGTIKEHNFGGDKPKWFAMVVAVIIGALALAAARYLRFVYADIPDVGTEIQSLALIDFGLASLVAFVAGAILRQKHMRHMAAHTMGIVLMMVAMHNLIWLYPSEFAQVYSADYVNQVKSLTSPQSIYVAGESYTL